MPLRATKSDNRLPDFCGAGSFTCAGLVAPPPRFHVCLQESGNAAPASRSSPPITDNRLPYIGSTPASSAASTISRVNIAPSLSVNSHRYSCRNHVFRPAEPGVPGPEPFNSLRHAPDTPEKQTQTEPEAKPHQPDPDTGGPTQDLKPNADECIGIVHSEPGCQAEHVCTTTGRCDCQSRCRITSHPTVQSEPR